MAKNFDFNAMADRKTNERRVARNLPHVCEECDQPLELISVEEDIGNGEKETVQYWNCKLHGKMIREGF